ncbi:6-bladed beta-propeller protein [Chitinophaga sp. YR627]|uniref:6-bladed beta-propeller n=1 Tax=Chitinophaga sp. YR627 TaxID=1881041 RepID=UPI0008E2042B|nr:6-bladed beta-propeller [Chitinophaga sp. YR627]SFM59584.1 6-bladed beta-propeller protein [Chitinophaga sp. YR627]
MKRIIWLSLLLFIAACSGGDYNYAIIDEVGRDSSFSKINLKENEPGPMNLSELVKRNEYIPLETSPDCLIGAVDKLIMTEDRIILMDKEIAKSLFVFDTAGKFLFKLKKQLGAPGEFTDLTDVTIDEKDSTIYLLSSRQQLLFAYDMHGHFKKTIHLPPYIDNVESLGKGDFLLTREGHNFSDRLGESRMMILTKRGSLEKGWFTNSLNDHISLDANMPIVPSAGSNFSFIRPFENLIYSFNRKDRDIKVKYQVDLGNTDLQELKESKNFDQLKKYRSKHGFVLGGMIDMNKYLYFPFYEKNSIHFYFKDKIRGKEHIIDNIVNDLDYIVTYPFQYGNDEYLASVLPTGSLIELSQAAKEHNESATDKKVEKLISFAENVDELDNPIIVKYYLN